MEKEKQQEQPKQKKKKGCLNTLFVIVGGIIVAAMLINNKKAEMSGDDESFYMTPKALWQEYNANEDAAYKKYFGKKIVLSVRAPFPMDVNDAGSLFTVFPVDKKGNGLVVLLNENNSKKLRAFSPHTKVCISTKVERVLREDKKLILQLSSKSAFEDPNPN